MEQKEKLFKQEGFPIVVFHLKGAETRDIGQKFAQIWTLEVY